MDKNRNIIIWVIIAIFIIAAAFVVFYFLGKSKEKEKEAELVRIKSVNQDSYIDNSVPCYPFSQSDYNKAANGVRLRCAPQSAIPFVGAGLYNKCVNKGMGEIPPVVNC